MAETELRIAGIGISKDVISTVVSGAAGNVEGVASVDVYIDSLVFPKE